MMRKTLTILLAVLAILAFAACKNKNKSKMPDGKEKVSEYATIPSFHSVFLALDKLEDEDLAGLAQTRFNVANSDTMRVAFAFGTQIANSRLAIGKKDKAWLGAASAQIQSFAPILRLTEVATKYDQGVQPLLASGDWDALETLLFRFQHNVDHALLELGKDNDYTFVALGIWSQTVNQVGGLIATNYSTEKSKVLVTPAWQALSENLVLMESEKYANTAAFKEALQKTRDLADMMNTAGTNPLNQEQVDTVVEAAGSIRDAFLNPVPAKETEK
jgi:hypothetical protein